MRDLLRTKIVCTIGPASDSPDTLTALAKTGMDVARLNFSHGDEANHGETIRRIRAVSAALGKPIAILCDLQGPKLRVGTMQDQGVALTAGDKLVLTTEHVTGAPGRIPVQYEHLPQAVKAGDRILIDDGLIELQITSVAGNEITTKVITGGLLQSNKGMNLPRASLAIPAITEKDKQDLRFALSQQIDWVALSFVRTPDEVMDIKALIRESAYLGRPAPVIAKIEKPEAIDNIDAIIAAADGIMVARGDLGIETAPEAVPMVQKMLIRKCNEVGKPVITATQMLDSMIRNPRPTRAEASDVANAILDGSDAIMLSGETAAGKYPVEAVETMCRIAQQVERTQATIPTQRAVKPGRSFAEAVAHASVETAIDLKAAAIVTPTVSGQTARLISRFRPPCPIVAVTPSPMAQRELVLFWGVYPLFSHRTESTDAVIADAVEAAHTQGYVSEGDVVVITGGSIGSGYGSTDLMKVHLIERVLARGVGLSESRLIGRIRRLTGPVDPALRLEPDEIVVAACTDRTFVRVLQRAAGFISATGAEPDEHCHLLALELGIPAILGVGEGLDALEDGMEVVMDARRGVVYERPASLRRGAR